MRSKLQGSIMRWLKKTKGEMEKVTRWQKKKHTQELKWEQSWGWQGLQSRTGYAVVQRTAEYASIIEKNSV